MDIYILIHVTLWTQGSAVDSPGHREQALASQPILRTALVPTHFRVSDAHGRGDDAPHFTAEQTELSEATTTLQTEPILTIGYEDPAVPRLPRSFYRICESELVKKQPTW